MKKRSHVADAMRRMPYDNVQFTRRVFGCVMVIGETQTFRRTLVTKYVSHYYGMKPNRCNRIHSLTHSILVRRPHRHQRRRRHHRHRRRRLRRLARPQPCPWLPSDTNPSISRREILELQEGVGGTFGCELSSVLVAPFDSMFRRHNSIQTNE